MNKHSALFVTATDSMRQRPKSMESNEKSRKIQNPKFHSQLTLVEDDFQKSQE